MSWRCQQMSFREAQSLAFAGEEENVVAERRSDSIILDVKKWAITVFASQFEQTLAHASAKTNCGVIPSLYLSEFSRHLPLWTSLIRGTGEPR